MVISAKVRRLAALALLAQSQTLFEELASVTPGKSRRASRGILTLQLIHRLITEPRRTKGHPLRLK